MHYKEYYRASDDAKLLPMMLPPSNARILIFGRPGDLQALHEELDADPEHALMLWPGTDALTIDQFIDQLPPTSPWHATRRGTGSSAHASGSEQAGSQQAGSSSGGGAVPTLRVVLLDAVYRHARTMFKHVQRARREASAPLRHVALHPRTLSVYSRAQHGYAQASAHSVSQSADPAALRICSVEAFALLLQELGEAEERTRPLVQAVITNNGALG